MLHIPALLLWLSFTLVAAGDVRKEPAPQELAHAAYCSVDGRDIPCAAAQWGGGGGPTRADVTGRAVRLQESCLSITPSDRLIDDSHSGEVAVALRGGCSFSTKALRAQALGFGGLVIIDYPSTADPMPPGLGDDSPRVFISVVMAQSAPWSNDLFSTEAAADATGMLVGVHLSFPDEATLWRSSPWYSGANKTLSFTPPSASRYAAECDEGALRLISDDVWLYRSWLEELRGAGGCKEVRDIAPSVTLDAASSIDTKSLESILALMAPWSCHGLIRLPSLDSSVSDRLDDPTVLNLDDGFSLDGLNSNSHWFPWGGANHYPRRFEGFVLVVRNGCILRDGIAVTPGNRSAGNADGLAEYHLGGCGCCPLGHGEIGSTFTQNNDNVTTMWAPKLISLVQRFHHGGSSLNIRALGSA